jgi:putative endonuclease
MNSLSTIHNYFVYILECSDGSYYTGVTNDLEVRLFQHNNGDNISAYTYSRRPLILKYYQRFDFIQHAIEFERQVKGWSRKKKEALFEENWNEIKRLSNLKKK